MESSKLVQPWKQVDVKHTRDLSGVQETWMQTLEDDRDLSATSMGSCLQASVVMNHVIVRTKAKASNLFGRLEKSASRWTNFIEPTTLPARP
ncbi:hypothetical protein PG991_006341 [Apiospora marii]|uniref:Uncharacterized protein n=1 Tax=Apiospora marii TaxID=335849 RepID=A0ABR1SBQ5_9PEZI